MKKLQIYVTSCNASSEANKYTSERKNNLIGYNKKLKQYFFKRSKEVIELEYGVIIFDEKFANFLIKMVTLSAQRAILITNEKSYVGQERDVDGLKSAIYNLVNKYANLYDCQKNCKKSCNDIFDFFTDLFIRLLKNQIYLNGNKRTSIISLRSLLHYYGYYLYWSNNDKYIYQKTYEQKLISFIKKLENKTGKFFEKERCEIKAWIYSNTTIALNWRD